MIEISDDATLIDLDTVHRWLSEQAYWCLGIPRETLARAMAGSLCFGAYEATTQVGFARVVTDGATFSWICDVFVDEAHRGRGIGKLLVEAVLQHPRMQGHRIILLLTRDAHSLYQRYGFAAPADPSRFLVIRQSPEQLYGAAGPVEDAGGR